MTKASEIIREAFKKLCAVSVSLPEGSEANVVRIPVAVATVDDVKESLVYIRDLLTDEYGDERQLSSEELEKICAIICKHLALASELVEDVLFDLTIECNEYHSDLWVLSTAIAEMIGKFQPKDDNEE